MYRQAVIAVAHIGVQDVSDAEMDDDDTALATASSWLPDPPIADIRRSSRARRTGDVIAALSSIYGSKEAFVSEYKCAPLWSTQALMI